MKKIILGFAAITILGLASCKREKFFEENLNDQKTENLKNIGNEKKNNFNGSFKISEKEIKDRADALGKSFLANYKQPTTQNKFGCVVINEIDAYFSGTNYDCGYPNTPPLNSYSVTIFEEGTSVPYTRTFDLITPYGTFPMTITNTSTTLLCPPWDPNGYLGECPRQITYNLTCITYGYTYGGISEATVRANTQCEGIHGNPPPPLFSIDKTLSFWNCGFPSQCEASNTSNTPGTLTVWSFTGAFAIVPPASQTLCNVPYLISPTEITFEYRLQGTTNWIGNNGNWFVSGLSQGTYEYKNVVFNYTIGNNSNFNGSSLPSVGVGTVPVY